MNTGDACRRIGAAVEAITEAICDTKASAARISGLNKKIYVHIER